MLEIDLLVHGFFIDLEKAIAETLNQKEKRFQQGFWRHSFGSEQIRGEVKIALCEDAVPILLLLVLEDVGQQKADERIGLGSALLGQIKDDHLYSLCGLYWQNFVLENE